MDKRFINIGQNKYPFINNGVIIGSWEEVKNLPTSAITKRDDDTSVLNGLIIRGYEMAFGKINENKELYDRNSFDKFINSYFVEKKLNLPIDIQHAGEENPEWLAGRVIYAETNTQGLYIIAYIPSSYEHYTMIGNLLREGILQGFSKCGYATDYESKYNEDGSFSHLFIKEFQLLSMSLVATPANGIPFEKLQEIKNNLVYVNIDKSENKQKPFNLLDL